MKILYLVQGFPPFEHSGTFRNEAFARHLPDFGIEPVIVAASDAGHTKVYAQSESWKDDPRWPLVVRVPWKIGQSAPPETRMETLGRKLPLAWTCVRRRKERQVLQRILPAAREALRGTQPSLIYSSYPPKEAVLAADRLARETGLPLIIDLRDPWTFHAWGVYRHWLDYRLELKRERELFSRAAVVIANTPTEARLLTDPIGIESSRIRIITNGYDESQYVGLPPRPSRKSNTFTILYAGHLAPNHPPDQPSLKGRIRHVLGIDYEPIVSDISTRSAHFFLQAVEQVLSKDPALAEVLRVVFVGTFGPSEAAVFKQFSFPQCLAVKPAVPHKEALRLTQAADLCLLLQFEMKLNGQHMCPAIPTKLYEYLRSGTRILAAVPPGDIQELVEQFSAGTVVPPKDIPAMSRAIRQEIEIWRRGGDERSAWPPPELTKYERRNLTRQLADLMFEVARSKAPA